MYKMNDVIIIEEVRDVNQLSIEGDKARIISRTGSLITAETESGMVFSFDAKGRKGIKVRPETAKDRIEELEEQVEVLKESIRPVIEILTQQIDIEKAGGLLPFTRARAKADLKELLSEINMPDGAVIKVTKPKKVKAE